MSLGKHNIQTRTQVRLANREVSLSGEEIARFWAKVARRGRNQCWLWMASVTGPARCAHGQFTIRRDGRQLHPKAHRIAWELTHGPITDGLNCCHHCDVPRCCNPRHLFLGTQADNLLDAKLKGRFHRPRTTVFSQDERLAIYALPYVRGLHAQLARQYGVTKAAITHIRQGRFIGAPAPSEFERVSSVHLPVTRILHVDSLPTPRNSVARRSA